MSRELFDQYSQFEDNLRTAFHRHRIYDSFATWSEEQFRRYLLQIGFIAQNFVRWYETAKQGMESEAAKEVIRGILREEIPQGAPTHQDERLHDLQLIGISAQRFRNTRPSWQTNRTIKYLFQLVKYPQPDYDLRVMVTLRIAGEVLVAEQYRHIVRYMTKRLGINPRQSRFFREHYEHDLKGGANKNGHTEAFDRLLIEMIRTDHDLEVAMDAAVKAFHARSSINDQFLPTYKVGSAIAAISKVAAAVVAVLFLGLVFQKASLQYEREHWAAHVAEQSSGLAVSMTECDLHLLHRFRQFHIAADLEKIGTPRACLDTWIGP